MNEEATYDLIERYLAGSISAAEQQAIEDRMLADPDFRQEVAIHRDLQNYLGSTEIQELETQIQGVLQRGRTKKNVRLLPYIAMAASLGLIILFYAIWKVKEVDPQQVIAQKMPLPEDFNPEVKFRNVEPTAVEEPMTSLDTFYELYRTGAHERALIVYNQSVAGRIDTLGISRSQSLYYQGILHLQLGQYEQAVTLLNQLDPSGHNAQVQWYIAYAHFKQQGWTPDVKAIFEQMASKPNPNQENAREILQALD